MMNLLVRFQAWLVPRRLEKDRQMWRVGREFAKNTLHEGTTPFELRRLVDNAIRGDYYDTFYRAIEDYLESNSL